MPEKEKGKERSDIDLIATPIIKFLIVCCLPWIVFSKLDKHLDENSEGEFDRFAFSWSFPATHLSWLVLTFLFGLPLWGLLAAPIVLPVCAARGVVDVGMTAIIIAGITVAGIWIGLYFTAERYRSTRELRKIREEVYGEEGDLNEA